MRTSVICFLLFVFFESQAQDVVNYEEISFSSEAEKEFFDQHFRESKTNYFNLLSANGTLLTRASLVAASQRFYGHLEKLGTEKLMSKKNDKKVKAIYDDLHKTFLVKYNTKNRFEEIFYNGSYNCLSASALYALAFHQLKIPFTVKEEPTHVYLIAYPSAERIVIETTSPLAGYYTLSQEFKVNYVKTLKNQKIISMSEYTSQDAATLFDKYYFGNQGDVTILQLVGLQYMNDAIFAYEDKNFDEAVRQLEKAYLFYPSDRIAYLAMASLAQAIQSRPQKDSVHAQMVGKFSRYKRYGATSDMIKGELYNAMSYWVLDRGDKPNAEIYYNALLAKVVDPALKEELTFLYNYELGRNAYNKGHYRATIPYLETCLKVKPSHDEATALLIHSLGRSLRNTSNKECMSTFESFGQKYPGLYKDNVFNEFLTATYLIEFANGFKEEKPAEGLKYKMTFEKFYEAHKDVTLDESIIGQAYSAAAVYYFKKGQTSKARAVVAEGLKLSPENYQLKMSQRMLD